MKPQNRFKAIAFDFDYTLADSSNGAVDCINFALCALNLPPASNEAIYKTIGLSLSDTLVQLAGSNYKDKTVEFTSFFKKRADQVMAELTLLYPSSLHLIPYLKSLGLKLAIISTKFRYRILEILNREHLDEYFDLIIGGEDVLNQKPHPEALFLAQNKLCLASSEILYIGDSTTDALAAQSAEFPFLAVLTGVTAHSDFDNHSKIGIIRDLSEAKKFLNLSFGQKDK